MPSNYFIFRLRAIFGMKRTTFLIRISQGNISNSCGLWHAKEVLSQVHLRKNQLQWGARQVTSNYQVAPKRRSCRLSPTWVRTVNFKETHFQGKSKCYLFKNGPKNKKLMKKKIFCVLVKAGGGRRLWSPSHFKDRTMQDKTSEASYNKANILNSLFPTSCCWSLINNLECLRRKDD